MGVHPFHICSHVPIKRELFTCMHGRFLYLWVHEGSCTHGFSLRFKKHPGAHMALRSMFVFFVYFLFFFIFFISKLWIFLISKIIQIYNRKIFFLSISLSKIEIFHHEKKNSGWVGLPFLRRTHFVQKPRPYNIIVYWDKKSTANMMSAQLNVIIIYLHEWLSVVQQNHLSSFTLHVKTYKLPISI